MPNTEQHFSICVNLERCQSISLKSSSGRCLKGLNEASDLFVSVMEALGNRDVLSGYDESAEILLAKPLCIIQRARGCFCCCILLNYYYPLGLIWVLTGRASLQKLVLKNRTQWNSWITTFLAHVSQHTCLPTKVLLKIVLSTISPFLFIWKTLECPRNIGIASQQ